MRKLATIQEIKEVKDHPNADRLDIIAFKNLGWQCVSRKGTFSEGDKAIFFEIDSLIPMKYEWAKFLQDKNKPDKPARLKTMRLRSILSQGLAIPVSEIPELNGMELEEGQDVTEMLEILKYEPLIPACLNGEVKGARPSWLPKTDSDRIQAFPELLVEFQGKLVVIAQKIDGTSCSISYREEEEDVCGRNWSLKEGDNSYWKVAKKYDILRKLKEISEKTGINYGIQGECIGPGIQKNRLALSDHELWVFDVRNLNESKYLGFYERKEFCDRLQLQMVPTLQICRFEFTTIDELLELAKGKYLSGQHQEGIVIRPVHEFYSNVLKGRASFKVINNEFLEEGGD